MKQRLAETFPNSHALEIIQGGMGVRTSSYQLAGAVASHEATGLVSGTAIGTVLARGLNDGDPTGDLRWALEQYPRQEIVENILTKLYRDGGRSGKPYDRLPLFNIKYAKITADLAVVGAFAEVLLAKRDAGGRGVIGMNLLTKVDIPNAHTLYGAMQAGVDVVAMGAGIPSDIPKTMHAMAAGQENIPFEVSVTDKSDPLRKYFLQFEAERYQTDTELEVPRFLMIITNHILAQRNKSHEVPADGYIIEEPIAGGHNAPARNKALDEYGQPIYTAKDYADMERMRNLDVPFWLAGGYGNREGLRRALELGARGVQVGSIFALAEESGLSPELKQRMVQQIRGGEDISVYTDPLASPTNFPFKVAGLEGTLSESEVYENRERICDLGYLRQAYEKGNKPDGTPIVGYRCASEPVEDYVKKRGDLAATIGRKCICNGLLETVNMGQVRPDGSTEPAIVTIGDHVSEDVRNIVGPINVESILQSFRA